MKLFARRCNRRNCQNDAEILNMVCWACDQKDIAWALARIKNWQ